MNEVELRVMLGRRGPHFCVLLDDGDTAQAKPRSLLHCNPAYNVALMDETRLIGAYFGCVYKGRRRTAFSNAELIARTKTLAQSRRFSPLSYNCIDFVDELLFERKPSCAKYKVGAVIAVGIAILGFAVMLAFKALL